MATAIRMSRGGRTHKPYYRIVVTDSRTRDRGPEIDFLGVYHPCARPEPVSQVDTHKALEWLRKGARPSATARTVLSKLGVMKHFHDGTTPEENVAEALEGAVEDKGFNEAPEPQEAPAVEESAEAPTEETAEASGETEEKAE